MSDALAQKVSVKDFYLRRLHSLLGLFPVTVFLIWHMCANSMILKGPEAYNGMINALRSLPFLVTIEVTFIGLPILFHALYGIYITVTGSANLKSYGFFRNWLYVLQRVSGIIALVFIAYHVWQFRISTEIYHVEVTYETVGQGLRTPWVFWFYVVGLAGTMFHFANGLWLFCITWGITVGLKSQRVSGVICSILGIVFFAIGMQSMLAVVK